MPTRSLWQAHPHVRSGQDLTMGERWADALRNGMGSWPFVIGALSFLALWMVYNRGTGFDPYPFILLNLVLSCLAALQGAILLIAAKRADTISSELATHTYDIDQQTLEVTKSIAGMTQEIAELTRRIDGLTQLIHDHVMATVPANTEPGPSDPR